MLNAIWMATAIGLLGGESPATRTTTQPAGLRQVLVDGTFEVLSGPGMWRHWCPARIKLCPGDWIEAYRFAYRYQGEPKLALRESGDGRQTWLQTDGDWRLVALDARGHHGGRLLAATPLGTLSSLQYLMLDSRPPWDAEAIRHLDFSQLWMRTTDPELLLDWAPNIRHLTVWEPRGSDLVVVAKMRRLETLRFRAERPLEDLSPVGHLSRLRMLDLWGCSGFTDLRPLGRLTHLEILQLGWAGPVEDLSPLANLRRLRVLSVPNCVEEVDLSPLTVLLRENRFESLDLGPVTNDEWLREVAPLLAGQDRLRQLTLRADELTDLSPVGRIPHLRSLKLWHCRSLTDLSPLAGMRELEHVWIHDSPKLADLRPLAKLPRLRRLTLGDSDVVKDLGPLIRLVETNAFDELELDLPVSQEWLDRMGAAQARFGRLTRLVLRDGSRLTSFAPLAGLKELRYLRLYKCEQVASLKPLAKLAELRSLTIPGGRGQVASLPSLRSLPKLRFIDLSAATGITELVLFRGFAELRGLSLGRADHLVDLNPPPALLNLRGLHLYGAARLTRLEPLARLTRLQSLSLSNCDMIDDVKPLSHLRDLTILRLSFSDGVFDLRPLAGLPDLEYLDLWECRTISGFSLRHLYKAKALRRLHLTGCTNLTAADVEAFRRRRPDVHVVPPDEEWW